MKWHMVFGIIPQIVDLYHKKSFGMTRLQISINYFC